VKAESPSLENWNYGTLSPVSKAFYVRDYWKPGVVFEKQTFRNLFYDWLIVCPKEKKQQAAQANPANALI